MRASVKTPFGFMVKAEMVMVYDYFAGVIVMVDCSREQVYKNLNLEDGDFS